MDPLAAVDPDAPELVPAVPLPEPLLVPAVHALPVEFEPVTVPWVDVVEWVAPEDPMWLPEAEDPPELWALELEPDEVSPVLRAPAPTGVFWHPDPPTAPIVVSTITHDRALTGIMATRSSFRATAQRSKAYTGEVQTTGNTIETPNRDRGRRGSPPAAWGFP